MGLGSAAVGRRGYIWLGVGAFVLVLAMLAWVFRPQDEPQRASVEDAVRSFRAEEEARAKRRSRGPAHGVYRYATRGGESAETIIGGAEHDYDGVSTIVLRAGRCGEIERWQVLSGRWTEAESCRRKDGNALVWLAEFHEFFGVGRKDSFECRGDSAPAAAELRPGMSFANVCESDESSVASTLRVAGLSPVTVAGESFKALHTVSRSSLSGQTTGSARREDWRRRSDGLLLRRRVASEADSSAEGGTSYSERYTLRLLETAPKR